MKPIFIHDFIPLSRESFLLKSDNKDYILNLTDQTGLIIKRPLNYENIFRYILPDHVGVIIGEINGEVMVAEVAFCRRIIPFSKFSPQTEYNNKIFFERAELNDDNYTTVYNILHNIIYDKSFINPFLNNCYNFINKSAYKSKIVNPVEVFLFFFLLTLFVILLMKQ